MPVPRGLDHAAPPLPRRVLRRLACGIGSLVLATTPVQAADALDDGFKFEDGPELPVELTDAVVGRAFDDLMVAGGLVIGGDTPAPNQAVYVLRDETWQEAGSLEALLVGAAVAETGQGLVCLGSRIDGAPSTAVSLLDPRGDDLAVRPLPDLPFALEGVAAVGVEDKVYVVGHRAGDPAAEEARAFLVLDLAATDGTWEILEPCPGPARLDPAMAALLGKVYVFGGTEAGAPDTALADGCRYDPGYEWTALSPAPEGLTGRRAVACGASHILLAGGQEPRSDLLGYHAILDRWVELAQLPQAVALSGATGSGTEFTLVDGSRVLQGEAVLTPTKYGWLDHTVVLLFLAGMLFIGVYLAKRERHAKDFFRGGQRIPWWASGLSLFATAASAISLMAMPGKSYAENWIYFTVSIYSVFAYLPLAVLVFTPIARRLKVATSNEYLERRFNLGIRLFGGVIFALNQMLARMASIMLLPSIALSAIVGIPMETSILIMGVVTTIYVTLGGLEAVVWTDVIQALVMLASVLICIVAAAISLTTDASTAMQILADQHKLKMFELGFDLLRPTVFIMATNVLIGSFGALGDQNFIQRVQCTPTEKEARKAVITQMSVAVPLNVVLFSLGTVLFLFYRERPELLNPALKTDGIYPLFAAQVLPVGVAGLVVASLLAATMSTLSSAVNSVANIAVEDFYRRLWPRTSDHAIVVLGRVFSIVLGIFGTGAALLLARTSLTSIWDLAVLVTGIVAAPIAGIFTLGVFTRRANTAGVLAGSVAAVATTLYARYGVDVHPFLVGTLGILACVVVGYVSSLVLPSAKRDLDGLTVYTLSPPEKEETDV